MESRALRPCAFSTFTAFTGYLMSPRVLIVLTASIASTAMGANTSSSLEGSVPWRAFVTNATHLPMILLDMLVFAALISASFPSASTLMLSWSCMYLTASRHARR